MPALFVETDPATAAAPRFSADPRPLLALISFGVAEPFGTQHPLTELIRGPKRGHGIDVGPLLTFYDRDVEDAEDAAMLDAAWQPAAALRDCAAAARAAIAADMALAELAAGEPDLPALLADLEAMATAVGEGRIRLSFRLGDG